MPPKRPKPPPKGALASIPLAIPPRKPRAQRAPQALQEQGALDALMVDDGGPRADAMERALLDVGTSVDLLTDIPSHMVFHVARLRWFADLLARREVDFMELDRLTMQHLRLSVSRDRKSRGEMAGMFTAREERKRILTTDKEGLV